MPKRNLYKEPLVPYEEQIEYILDEFDFESVRNVFIYLSTNFERWRGWRICGKDDMGIDGLPPMSAFRRQARKLLKAVADTENVCRDYNAPYFEGRSVLSAYNTEGTLKLSFEVVEESFGDTERQLAAWEKYENEKEEK